MDTNTDFHERLELAIQDYLRIGGLTAKQVQEKYGIHPTSLRRHVAQRGLRLNPKEAKARQTAGARKLGKMMAGRTLSPETRKKISEARRRTNLMLAQLPLPEMSRCADCKEYKPLSEFYMRLGKPHVDTGIRTRTPDSYCKECNKRRVREYRKNLDPEVKRERDRIKHAKYLAKHGSEKVRETKEFYRQRKREEENRQRAWNKGRYRKTSSKKADPGMPLAPFQAWIIERAAFYAERDAIDVREGAIAGLGQLALICGVSDRTLRRFLNGYETTREGKRREITTVPLGTVDQCLTNEGSTALWELYNDSDYATDEELLTAA